MRKHARLGFLVALLAALAVAVYVQQQAMASDPSTFRVVELGQTIMVSTIRLELGADLLARLDAGSPKLMLEAADGSRATVMLWKIDRGEAVLQQFHNLQEAHYTTLLVTWPDGATERVPIDVDPSTPSEG